MYEKIILAIQKLLYRVMKYRHLDTAKNNFTETQLERIQRLQQGISLEEVMKDVERGYETPLQKVKRLQSEQIKQNPGPKIEYIDTSKICNPDLITFTKKKRG